ncbi:death domain-containing protein 1-like [Saccoglossus kowalevskii]|uniref:Death domain-containing protein 1-like n=1 Tax=Saccoglossus kowalevskii TaxID=10224 RepID=A0ABM0LWJ9_SACKO|nr:PREDICTED: death domain-containing protein 1-like [Saccoglossus kowalevskii]
MEKSEDIEKTMSSSSSDSDSDDDSGSSGSSDSSSEEAGSEQIVEKTTARPQSSNQQPATNDTPMTQQHEAGEDKILNYTKSLSDLSENLRQQNTSLRELDDITNYNGEGLRQTLEDTMYVLQRSRSQVSILTQNITDIRQVMLDLKNSMQDKLKEHDLKLSASQTNLKAEPSVEQRNAEALAAAAAAGLAKATIDVAEAIKSAAEVENKAAEAAVIAQKTSEESLKHKNETEEAAEKIAKKEQVVTKDETLEKEEEKKKADGNESDSSSSSGSSGSSSSGSDSDSDSSGSGSSDSDSSSDEEKEGEEKNQKMEKKEQDENKIVNGEIKTENTEWKDIVENNNQNGDSRNSSPDIEDEIIHDILYKYYIQPKDSDETELGCILRAKQLNFAENEITCDLANHLSGNVVDENEQLVSHVIDLHLPGDNMKLTSPVSIAIPYMTHSRASYARESIVKTSLDGIEWKTMPTTTSEGTLSDGKKLFAEIKVNQLSKVAVVVRWTRDRVTITKKGGTIKSSVDSRISVTYPPGACGLTSVVLQVHPVELTAVSDIKSRLRHCRDLITSSPILRISHSSKKEFNKPVTVVLYIPPNPAKDKPASRPSTAKDPFSRPTSGFLVRPRSAIFGSDHTNDVVRILSRMDSGKGAPWTPMEVEVKVLKKDVVAFNLDKPVDRIIGVRYAAQSTLPLEQAVQSLEDSLQIKYACVILHPKVDDAEQVIVQVVQSRSLDSTERRLVDMGYEGPPDPSTELPMTEGQLLRIRFTGNIEVVDETELTLNWHVQRRNVIEFRIREANKYGNHSSPYYKGVAEIYGIPRVTLEEKEEDEFEADKETKDGKKDGKDAKKAAREARELKETKGKTKSDLLCKLPVVLPKAEPDPVRPPSRFRATALESKDPHVSNSILRWLSGELGHEWEALAAYLGLKRSRMQSIVRNNPNDLQQQIFDMLITWRSSLPRSCNKVPKLARALSRCGRSDLTEDFLSRD